MKHQEVLDAIAVLRKIATEYGYTVIRPKGRGDIHLYEIIQDPRFGKAIERYFKHE